MPNTINQSAKHTMYLALSNGVKGLDVFCFINNVHFTCYMVHLGGKWDIFLLMPFKCFDERLM